MLSDNEIVLRVQGGERELFGELHVRHHERIYRYVSRSIFEREAAQDVACEVWLRAYAAVDKFEPRSDSSVIAWLMRITSNLITDYRRRLPTTNLADETENEPILQLVSPAAEREVFRHEQAYAVRRAMQTLSDGDRQIIHLAHQDDLSCRQIADVLGKPSVSAVTSHLYRAMRHLKTALEQSGWFGEYHSRKTKMFPSYVASRSENRSRDAPARPARKKANDVQADLSQDDPKKCATARRFESGAKSRARHDFLVACAPGFSAR